MAETVVQIHSRKQRKKAELPFHDEEPMFSDTDDEMEFEQNFTRFITKNSNCLGSKVNVNKTFPRQLEDILEFSDECVSCKKNKTVLKSLSNRSKICSDNRSPSISSTDSGVTSDSRVFLKQKFRSPNQGKGQTKELLVLLDKVTNNQEMISKANTNSEAVELNNTRLNGTKDTHGDENKKPGENESQTKEGDAMRTLLEEIQDRRRSIGLPCRKISHNNNHNSKPHNDIANGTLETPAKKFKSPMKVSKKSIQIKKPDYKFVDKNIFKLPVDITLNRSLENAIVRKLGRNAGSTTAEDSFTIERGDFRSFQTQKVRKLYSPSAWLNSYEISQMCLNNMTLSQV